MHETGETVLFGGCAAGDCGTLVEGDGTEGALSAKADINEVSGVELDEDDQMGEECEDGGGLGARGLVDTAGGENCSARS